MVMECAREDDNCKFCCLKQASVEQETRENQKLFSTLGLIWESNKILGVKIHDQPRNVVEARGSLTAVEVQR